MKFDVYKLIGENAITPDDGQKIYDLIHPELQKSHPLELDFSNVNVFASPFFNFCIGKLIEDIEPRQLNELLHVTHINTTGKQVLMRVIENAKQYYKNDKRREIINAVIQQQANSAWH